MFVVIVDNADEQLGTIAGVYDNPDIVKELTDIYGPPNKMVTGAVTAEKTAKLLEEAA